MIDIATHFYTLKQAAEKLGVERHTIWRWVKMNKLQAQKVGGVVFIAKPEVNKLRK